MAYVIAMFILSLSLYLSLSLHLSISQVYRVHTMPEAVNSLLVISMTVLFIYMYMHYSLYFGHACV